MKAEGMKFISSFLIFSLVALITPVTAKEKKFEFNLTPKKKNVQQIYWGYFSVKKDSIFSISEQTFLTNFSVYHKHNLYYTDSSWKPRFWKGAWKGALIGGVSLALLGFLSGDDDETTLMPLTAKEKFLYGGLLGIIIGGLIGGLIGVFKAAD